jgi:hypothetical protein
MTTKEHIQLLVHLNKICRGSIEASVPGGGELWDTGENAKWIAKAIRDLRQEEPTTFAAIDAVEQIRKRMEERGPAHFKRFDTRVAHMIREGHGLHEAMALSMGYEDVYGGFGEPMGLLAQLPEPFRRGYAQGRRECTEMLK